MSPAAHRAATAAGRFLAVVAVGVTFAFLAEWAIPGRSADPRPLPERYLSYWTNLLEPPVAERVGQALPWTLALVGCATLIAFSVGTLFGAWLAYDGHRRRTWLVALPAIVFACVPAFLVGKVLVAVLSQQLHWLPPALAFSPTQLWVDKVAVVLDLASHAVLPLTAIALAGIGLFAVSMRGASVTTMGSESALYAESLGLSRHRFFWAHVVRPAMVPQVTALALALGLIVGGALLVEQMFSYPGLGYTLYLAIFYRDVPVVRGITLVLIVSMALTTTVLDLYLPRLDPRLRGR